MTALFSSGELADLREVLLAIYRPHFRRVAANELHFQQMARDSLSEERSLEHLRALERDVGPLAGKRTLEVGSGIGLTLALARKMMDVEAFGIEPGDDEYSGTFDFSGRLLRAVGLDESFIRRGVGEAIPFPDGHFVVVFSSNVLEHVNDPPTVISEMIRVIKPGGFGHIIVPNYGSWWEGHYGIIWPPHLPAWLGKLYVRALGRDETFIDTLQLVTRGKLERWIAPHRERIEVLGWGVEVWEQRTRGLGFSEYSALGRLKGILRVLHRLKVIPLLIATGKALHWETPLILCFRKR